LGGVVVDRRGVGSSGMERCGVEERRAVEWIGLEDKPKPARGIDERVKDGTFEG
jgi:hypothetical protein